MAARLREASMTRWKWLSTTALSCALLFACAITAYDAWGTELWHGGDARGEIPASMLASYQRPATVPAPTGNPITASAAALGRRLFFDRRLSGSGMMSCATCHDPKHGWQDGRALSTGDGGRVLSRHTPTLLNVAWAEPLFWDGRTDTLEEQAKGPLANPQEMNIGLDKVVAIVGSDASYRAAFATAYPGGPIDINAISRAIATFERTLVSGSAPFDRRVAGDLGAISPNAARGFVLFNTKARCAVCHSGWRLTDDGFKDIGLPGTDLGRGKIVPILPILRFSFKTPTLRNIAARGPYMHDGSLPTLAAVIDHYNKPPLRRASMAPEIGNLHLSGSEKSDIVAFLESLTSRDEQ
jgi:cytochrome c peroxidase